MMIGSRNEALSLLSDGCEIEHALACAYLYAAMSIKTTLDEGLSWEQQQISRRWAAQIYFVASQEMLHLAQVWNLIIAIGGSAWIPAGEFPKSVAVVGKVSLQPFSLRCLSRFIRWESHSTNLSVEAQPHKIGRRRPPRTVGELYRQALAILQSQSDTEIFIGRTSAQLTSLEAHFPDLIRVDDLCSAEKAITAIVQQGEGTSAIDSDCHHGIFSAIKAELKKLLSLHTDPHLFTRMPPPAGNSPSLGHPAALFDDIFLLTMRLLTWAYECPTPDRKTAGAFCQTAIELMVTTLKPLGEAIFIEGHEDSAVLGPTFRLSRLPPLPRNPAIARCVVKEQLLGIAEKLKCASTGGRWLEIPDVLLRASAAL